jgi:tetratricopeptide (TPR) repeat protein
MDDVYTRYREALRLGHQEAAEGRFAQALSHYQVAAGAAPGRALPQIAIDAMHLRLGHVKESLAAYEQALQLEPANLDAMTGQTAALLAAGRREDAARVQRQMLDLTRPAMAEAPSPSEMTPMSRADTLMRHAMRRHSGATPRLRSTRGLQRPMSTPLPDTWTQPWTRLWVRFPSHPARRASTSSWRACTSVVGGRTKASKGCCCSIDCSPSSQIPKYTQRCAGWPPRTPPKTTA